MVERKAGDTSGIVGDSGYGLRVRVCANQGGGRAVGKFLVNLSHGLGRLAIDAWGRSYATFANRVSWISPGSVGNPHVAVLGA